MSVNDHLALICGRSATGKSTSLRNLRNTLYANCESGKRLPFKPIGFKEVIITDPYQLFEVFDHAETLPEIEYIVIDGLNYLMDMFESVHVRTATNTMAEWGNYAEFFRNTMQQKVARSTKRVIFTAHTRTTYNESEMVMETKVPIKGALANQGIESYFSTVVVTKKMRLKDLEGYENDLLIITPRDEKLGFKHVFQTMVTADTVNETMRSPMDMFTDEETFIDNDALILFKRLDEYYA